MRFKKLYSGWTKQTGDNNDWYWREGGAQVAGVVSNKALFIEKNTADLNNQRSEACTQNEPLTTETNGYCGEGELNGKKIPVRCGNPNFNYCHPTLRNCQRDAPKNHIDGFDFDDISKDCIPQDPANIDKYMKVDLYGKKTYISKDRIKFCMTSSEVECEDLQKLVKVRKNLKSMSHSEVNEYFGKNFVMDVYQNRPQVFRQFVSWSRPL